jgi:hypothetical protein
MPPPSEAQLIDFFIFDAEDIDIGTFSRAETDEVAAHFKIDPKAAYRALNALAKKDLLSKTRDTMKKHRGAHAVGYQWWEYYWKPGDLERFNQRQGVKESAMKPNAKKAGADYAHEQLSSEYFQQWVWEQLYDAEEMRRKDPSSVLPMETPAMLRKIARNMLQQLGWDTKRELKESREFFEGFDEELRKSETVNWLADLILEMHKDVQPSLPGISEAKRAKGADLWSRYRLATRNLASTPPPRRGRRGTKA